MTKALNILYITFNSACMIVFAYQSYLWLRAGTWTKIATHILIPDWPRRGQLIAEWQGIGRVLHWILNVELSYTLGSVAVVFYVMRLMSDKKR